MSKQSPGHTDFAASTRDLQAGFERLEKREWWRWSAALIIMLLLTLGVLSLSLPGLRQDTFTDHQLTLATRGLLALVVLFDVFAIHQQISISSLRRDLANQIGILATLEAVKPATPEEQAGQKERRRTERHPFDQRLKVITRVQDKDVVLYGRVIDISELGLGAVVSGTIERGERVLLEFSAPGEPILRLSATVRYARGFRHGLEFFGLGKSDTEILRRLCANGG
jgi:PilZ domain-containing protein